MSADPKSAKRYWLLDCHFALLGSAWVKVACKLVGEIDPLRRVTSPLLSINFVMRKIKNWKSIGSCTLGTCFRGLFINKFAYSYHEWRLILPLQNLWFPSTLWRHLWMIRKVFPAISTEVNWLAMWSKVRYGKRLY